ncbi:Probable HTH-type transcriptional regulator ygaV [Cedecea neteri]|uniref:Transcriptional regulator n=1 Tax=Cedecea neteri TaxID=158822 RepID=A0A291DUD2_9ENTR|nr:metalloregulator ArsR/SmtB family transcription factor [Cedecea neteri]ATF91312.1 transcriptional regulator [Cedecea neteri]SQA99863.1 Probable HTH-type transcriptional regulator ygaV [Cedecea neteri]
MTPELSQLQSSADEAAKLLKAMSNPRRLLILCLLLDSPGTGAGELAAAAGLSPSATSQHLAKMKDDGLLEHQRNAQRVLYFIKDNAVREVIATLKTIYCP